MRCRLSGVKHLPYLRAESEQSEITPPTVIYIPQALKTPGRAEQVKMSSQRLLTAKTFLSYFTSLDESILEPILAENYYHEFAPVALNPPGPFGRAGFLAHTSGLKKVMSSFPIFTKEYIESESGNQVVVWATSQAHFREEVRDHGINKKEWEYSGEYIFMFTMDESGEKVVRCVEFLDSLGTQRLMGLMKRAKGNLQG